jgi:hypothetical protein
MRHCKLEMLTLLFGIFKAYMTLNDFELGEEDIYIGEG